MGHVWQDLRYAARKLARNPGFTLVAVSTLALGIGASTAIFSVVDVALLRALPFASPDHLVTIFGVAGPDRDIRGGSWPEIRDWGAMSRSFTDVSIYDETTMNLSGLGPAEMLESEIVSPGYFRLLGVSPQLGRGLLPEDDVPGAAPAVVISHALWQERFDGKDDVLGRTIVLDDRQALIVGVMPEGFRGLSFDTQVWTTLLPFVPEAAEDRGDRWLWAVGRLRPGVTLEGAQDDIENVARQLESEYPATNRERSADLVPLRDYYLGTTRTLLLVVLGAVGFLMLIACVNVINLQIMRGIGRRGEVALRHALGAGRRRLVGQFTTEAALLAVIGGVLGVAIAWLGTGSLVALVPAGVLPGYVNATIDGRVLLVAAGIVAVTGVLSGVAPALRGTHPGVAQELRARSNGTAAPTAGASPLQRALVAVEVALAVTLIGSAALMVRSLVEQLEVDPGFRPDNVLVAGANLTGAEYADDTRIRFVTRLVETLRAAPGVTAVAVGSDAPLRGSSNASILFAEGRPDDRMRYYWHSVTPGYFATLGIDLVRGRGFEPSDDADAPRVVIVSEAFAAKLWPGRDGVGRYLELGQGRERATVIGVAANVRFRDLTSDLFSAGEDPDVWFPYPQRPSTTLEILVRSGTSDLVPADVVQRAIAGLDPSVPLVRAQPLADVLGEQTGSARFGSVILALFAGLALVLCGIGLYGVMAFFVASRRPEIAVRMALGAKQAQVLAMIVRQGMALVGIGVIAGLAAVVAGARLAASLLFGVSPADPLVHVSCLALLATIALAACLLPAWRATRIDPTEALRAE